MGTIKRFDMPLCLAEYYAIRHALELKGDEPELLARINNRIEQLHKYFDGSRHRHECLEGLSNKV